MPTCMLAAWLVLPLASSLQNELVCVPPGRLLMKGEMSTPCDSNSSDSGSKQAGMSGGGGSSKRKTTGVPRKTAGVSVAVMLHMHQQNAETSPHKRHAEPSHHTQQSGALAAPLCAVQHMC